MRAYCYGWFREGICLHIGKTFGLLNLQKHSVIGKKSPINATDIIAEWDIAPFEKQPEPEYLSLAIEARLNKLEQTLIEQYRPAYNKIAATANWQASEHRVCKNPACKDKFMPTRFWQEFCNPECQRQAWRDKQKKEVRVEAVVINGMIERKCRYSGCNDPVYFTAIDDKTKNIEFCPSCRPLLTF